MGLQDEDFIDKCFVREKFIKILILCGLKVKHIVAFLCNAKIVC